MPKTPTGHKRPADVIGNAVHVMKIATGEASESDPSAKKHRAAVELGSLGGKARAENLSTSERIAIAKKGAAVRWKMKPKPKRHR